MSNNGTPRVRFEKAAHLISKYIFFLQTPKFFRGTVKKEYEAQVINGNNSMG
jgi:hypothetical protein